MKHIHPEIGLSDRNREAIAQVLNALLADEYLLYTKTRNYHWNIRGSQFNDLHRLFEKQYEELEEVVDEVAERARSLGHWALGSMTEFLQQARLKEAPGQYPEARDMIANLLADHEALVRQLRGDLVPCLDQYGDAGTNDFLTGLMRQHEKTAWMLRALLEEK
jgi:starvation-inducible DNA-binding protein